MRPSRRRRLVLLKPPLVLLRPGPAAGPGRPAVGLAAGDVLDTCVAVPAITAVRDDPHEESWHVYLQFSWFVRSGSAASAASSAASIAWMGMRPLATSWPPTAPSRGGERHLPRRSRRRGSSRAAGLRDGSGFRRSRRRRSARRRALEHREVELTVVVEVRDRGPVGPLAVVPLVTKTRSRMRTMPRSTRSMRCEEAPPRSSCCRGTRPRCSRSAEFHARQGSSVMRSSQMSSVPERLDPGP